MIERERAINEFSQLAYAEKKQKLLNLFVLFEANSQVIKETKPFLLADKLSQEDMTTYYGYLVEIITNLKEEDLMVSMKGLDEIHQKLLKMQQKEEEERRQEDPEALLQSI